MIDRSTKLQNSCNPQIKNIKSKKYDNNSIIDHTHRIDVGHGKSIKNNLDLSSLENNRNNAVGKAIINDVFHLHKLRYIAWKITGINDNGIYRKHPVSICGKYPFKDSTIEIWSNENKDKSYLKNLCSCNSVWACPIDRFKIMSVRTNEIINISKGEQSKGKYMAFLTLTKKHKKHTSLDELQYFIKSFNKDFREITAITSIKNEKETSGFRYIKAFETMYNSVNGFHPHFHLILFADSRQSLDRIAKKIINAWLNKCPGTIKENQKLIQVFDNYDEELEKYISKMNMALELTNLYSNKTGKYFSINPLDALNMLLIKDFSIFSEYELKKVYNEYIYVTKGIRSITYSKGLKSDYKIIDKTDEEICSDDSELKNHIVKISYSLYSRLVRINATHELLKCSNNYLKNDSTILIELRKIITDRLQVPIEYYKNEIVCSDEISCNAPDQYCRDKKRQKVININKWINKKADGMIETA